MSSSPPSNRDQACTAALPATLGSWLATSGHFSFPHTQNPLPISRSSTPWCLSAFLVQLQLHRHSLQPLLPCFCPHFICPFVTSSCVSALIANYNPSPLNLHECPCRWTRLWKQLQQWHCFPVWFRPLNSNGVSLALCFLLSLCAILPLPFPSKPTLQFCSPSFLIWWKISFSCYIGKLDQLQANFHHFTHHINLLWACPSVYSIFPAVVIDE